MLLWYLFICPNDDLKDGSGIMFLLFFFRPSSRKQPMAPGVDSHPVRHCVYEHCMDFVDAAFGGERERVRVWESEREREEKAEWDLAAELDYSLFP